MAAPQTVFVTGASGFIAKHIIAKLLNAGYRVIGSVRSLPRATEVRDAVLPHLQDSDDLDDRLQFAALDLAKDAGWDSALSRADILMHTASPFPMAQPRDENDVIRPAVDGALRALRAAKAAGIGRVVMTSSTVAVVNTHLPAGRDVYDEQDWSDLNHPGTNPYAKSKTLAERAAWEFVRDEAPDIALTVINPAFVLGPPLDKHYGTSIKVIERLLHAKDPMLPRFGFPVVDVRDVAELHLRALSKEETTGERFVAVSRFLWFHEMAEILTAAYPDRKIVTRRAPNLVVRILAIFDPSIRSVLPTLGKRQDVSGAKAQKAMDITFFDAADSVLATGAYLIESEIV